MMHYASKGANNIQILYFFNCSNTIIALFLLFEVLESKKFDLIPSEHVYFIPRSSTTFLILIITKFLQTWFSFGTMDKKM